MEVTVLEAIGTLGAGTGGLAGLYLLGRGLWRMWSGQLEEQRLLLGDARKERSELIQERNTLREAVREADERCAELEKDLRDNNEHLRHQLYECHVKRRQWAEYSSQLRRQLIEHGVPVEEIADFPDRTAVGRGDGVD